MLVYIHPALLHTLLLLLSAGMCSPEPFYANTTKTRTATKRLVVPSADSPYAHLDMIPNSIYLTTMTDNPDNPNVRVPNLPSLDHPLPPLFVVPSNPPILYLIPGLAATQLSTTATTSTTCPSFPPLALPPSPPSILVTPKNVLEVLH